MTTPDQIYLIVMAVVAAVLVVALNVWAYRHVKNRGLTMKDAIDEARDDPHLWWP